MNSLQSVRSGFYWFVMSGLVFGVSERTVVCVNEPSAENLGLLTVSSLFGVCIAFLKPEELIMGWNGGYDIISKLVPVLVKRVPDLDARSQIYESLLDALRDADWDCEYEAEGLDPALDELLDLGCED